MYTIDINEKFPYIYSIESKKLGDFVANKADTSIDQLLNIIKRADGDNQLLNNLLKALQKTIPTTSTRRNNRRKNMSDTNLNKTFNIKRINHSVLATIVSSDENMYRAKIVSIVDGETNNKVGDELLISKRELELTGRPTSSKS